MNRNNVVTLAALIALLAGAVVSTLFEPQPRKWPAQGATFVEKD